MTAPREAPAATSAAGDGNRNQSRVEAWFRARVERVSKYFGDLPEWMANPPSLADIWHYARKGTWTTAAADSGVLRKLATAWACVAIFIVAPYYLLGWSAGRFLRCAFCWFVYTIVGTALAQIPVLDLFIPPIFNTGAW